MASATQPQSQKLETGKSNFGGAPVDGNRSFLVGVGSFFQTQDATPTTALVSPLSVTTGTVVPLVIPLNAVSITIVALTNPVAISEVTGTSSLSQYFQLPSGQSITISVARQAYLYLLGVTGTSVVSFIFNTI